MRGYEKVETCVNFGSLNSMKTASLASAPPPRIPQDVGLCDCGARCDICCLAMVAPCWVHYETSRKFLTHVRPDNVGPCIANPWLAGFFGLVGIVLEVPGVGALTACLQSMHIREEEDCCCACLTATCCYPCVLTQNWRSVTPV
jgi:hypothetical protein